MAYKRGDMDNHFKEIQNLLQMKGGDVIVNGIYDLNTEIAIVDFQELAGLTSDHFIGPRTTATLQSSQDIKIADKIDILLEVPFFSQRDNQFNPSGSCNVTSLAMLMAFNGIDSHPNLQLEDTLYKALETQEAQKYFIKNYPQFHKQGYNPRNIHGMLQWLVKLYNFDAEFVMNLTWEGMRSWLKTERQPIITSGRFTKSGHIVLIVGMTLKGHLIVHDPWGDWNTAYQIKNGNTRLYEKNDMMSILKGNSSKEKMAHLITR